MSIGDEAARRLAAIVESSDDAIISKDLNGVVTSWNPAAERMFGFTAAEMIGSSIRRIIPAERNSEEDRVLSLVRNGDRVEHFETIRQKKSGQLFPISLAVSPIRNADGTVIGASKIARDISESVRLRHEAREQADITTRLAQIGSEVSSTLNRDVVLQRVTDAAIELTHAEYGVFDGTFHGVDVVRIDDATLDPLLEQEHMPPDFPHGDKPVRSFLAIPIKAASGQMLGGLCFGHSSPGMFTAQHVQLAAGVAAWASVALQNAYLYVEAREANRMKDDFLAVLSHELRTPLNSIMGYSRLIRDGVLHGEKMQRGLDTLERSATALNQIVEDVLDVSRIVTGKMRLDVRPVDLPALVRDAIATVSPAAEAKDIRISTQIDVEAQPILADTDRLQQVVWNLLTNAVKFTPAGGAVRIRLTYDRGTVELAVADTGNGIAREFLPHVFERFRQADSGSTRKTGGLGLGLAIVRHIVEMHGGTVHVDSAGEGQGSTFRVRLPMTSMQSQASAPARGRQRRDVPARVGGFADLRGILVLAIDDEHDALTLLRVILEAAGAEVRVLGSAIGAIEEIAARPPHALVVDLGMPELDGFEFINRVRASLNPAVRSVPAAALTAFARSEDRSRALRSGFDMHLAKPIDPHELVNAVATLVRGVAQEKAGS